jgi:mono/diheme cytochrome c family protein
MIKPRIFFRYIVLLGIGVFGTAHGVTSTEVPATVDAEAIYNKHCSTCHGDQGNGQSRAQSDLRPPPRDFTTLEAALELTRERMIDSVTNGRPGTAMMAHKDRLSTEQIAAVVDYIRKKFMRTPDGLAGEGNERGKQLFVKNCAVCHGDKGNTAVWARNGLNPPPRDFTTAEARRILTRDRMIHSVTHGRPGTGMMSFTTKLNADDIEAVVDYIRSAFMHVDKNNQPIQTAEPTLPSSPYENQPRLPRDSAHATVTPEMAQQRAQQTTTRPNPHAALAQRTNPHAGPHQGRMPAFAPQSMPMGDADMSLPFPNGLKGDPVQGREFFMNNCFTCHGVTGQGNGPRAYFNTPRPRNFTSDESRRILNRVRLFTGISNGRVGTVMPAWSKVLTDQQIANVAEFVFQAFVQPEQFPEISGVEPVTSPSGEPDETKKKAL